MRQLLVVLVTEWSQPWRPVISTDAASVAIEKSGVHQVSFQTVSMSFEALAVALKTDPIEVAKLFVSIVTLGGTAFAAYLAFRSFHRTEQWKRAEFLAKEMKEFFDNPKVVNALLLIDWSSRRILLPISATDTKKSVKVTRELQVRALFPHAAGNGGCTSGDDGEFEGEEQFGCGTRIYSQDEAAIRDCYDALLDGLERFSSYARSGLVDRAALRPYLGYWLDKIYEAGNDRNDAPWAATLLAYITFYGFIDVQQLFVDLKKGDISCHSAKFRGLLEKIDTQIASDLAKAVNVEFPVRAT